MQTPTTQLFELEKQALERWNFFYRIVQTRLSYNMIRSFILASGVVLNDPLDMSSHAVCHFTNILGPVPAPQVAQSSVQWFQGLTPFRCSQDQGQLMTSIPTLEEIASVLLKLNPNKASGPDGLTSGFYKSAWSILGTEVVTSIRHFFYTSFMPSTTNSTILTLVPKHPGASQITDFRPIACLNTLYKVVSRLLVRRLKPILSHLIVPSQTCLGPSYSLALMLWTFLNNSSPGSECVCAQQALRLDTTV